MPRRPVFSQELLKPRSFTPPRPMSDSHTQINSLSSQDDESIINPHTPSSLKHPISCTSKFIALQQPSNSAFPRLTNVMINTVAMVGSSTSSPTPPRRTEQVQTPLRFSAPDLMSRVSAGQEKECTSQVFRPWE